MARKNKTKADEPPRDETAPENPPAKSSETDDISRENSSDEKPPTDEEPKPRSRSKRSRDPEPASEPERGTRNSELPAEPETVHALRLTRDVSLGGGTRKRGELLGYVALMPGVDLHEIRNALCNPRCCGL